MSRVSRPYFNLHQIERGKYTEGNEFVLADGTIYVGSYHVLPTGQRFTEFRPNPKSVELFEIRLNPTADILKYNQLSGNQTNKYVSPVSFQPIPTSDDYKVGRIERFFIQKRNSPENTIMEIDFKQFNGMNTQNNEGINGVLWNRLKIEWVISKIPFQDAAYINQLTIQRNLPNFPGLNGFLTDYNEFYR